MANDEVLGPRKTMFVLVIVVGCFAVLWPRILSPLILGHSREQLKPNQFDRDAGCCEVIFEPEVAVLELVNEVCSSAIGGLSPQSAAECRRAVNETCGMDIAAIVKQKENVGKTMKMLVETMKNSNSTCLRNNFGVPIYSLSSHFAANSWTQPDTVKQERPPIRMGPHPALRERGRAIPPGAPPPSKPVALPPHLRVRSPLSVYIDIDIKPPPIPGMRPPLGSPGGPVPAPKSSMGFVMPVYTICIIVFFVYTLSKILFKRSASPYEPVPPDPQFRRRVFRDDSRTSPDKLVVSAISGLVAEVQQQMETNYVQNQHRQEPLDSTRPYTNGSIVLNSGPVQIVTSEYQEQKEKSPEPQKIKEPSPEPIQSVDKSSIEDVEAIEQQENSDISKTITKEDLEITDNTNDQVNDLENVVSDKEIKDSLTENAELEHILDNTEATSITEVAGGTEEENEDVILGKIIPINNKTDNEDISVKLSEEFINIEKKELEEEKTHQRESTPELLEEALKEDSPQREHNVEEEKESSSVKVIGMEMTADGGTWPPTPAVAPAPAPPHRPHEAEQVKSIYLETEIPQQSRVLIADFAENRTDSPTPAKNAQPVVSGKITLSLIQDAPRETPDRDPESTVDDFTTASALTQPAQEKEDDLSDEEIEEVEEIEVEEIDEEEIIEEEIEEEEVEEVEELDEDADVEETKGHK